MVHIIKEFLLVSQYPLNEHVYPLVIKFTIAQLKKLHWMDFHLHILVLVVKANENKLADLLGNM